MMQVLLDTHTLLWWFNEPNRLSAQAAAVMENSANQILVSAATGWELSIKVNLGKINALGLVAELEEEISEDGFAELPVTLNQAVRAGLLPLHHRDPFDRLLVAQAQDLNVPILSSDRFLDAYDIKRLW